MPAEDAWSWLRQHEGSPRFGFTRRDGTGLFGAGIAEQVEGDSIAEVLTTVRERGGTWFVGGSFDPLDTRAPWWMPFGAARAWRPQHIHPEPFQPVLLRPPVADGPVAQALGRLPDRSAWDRLVGEVVAHIQDGEVDKVVLARTITEATSTDALGWLSGLRSAPREMAFLFEPVAGLAFAGLTPELLFDRKGRRVHSEALAGTGLDTPDGRDRLLASDKDAREHQLVVDAVAEALAPVCAQVDRSALQLTRTGRLVHRLVTFEGRLADTIDDAELARQLHPTPAVAGTPRRDALAYLRDHEPFDRGWYAGPVGLVEPERTTLSVALRCALWQGTTRTAFTGCGLVDGSDAAAEWDETELKSQVVRRR